MGHKVKRESIFVAAAACIVVVIWMNTTRPPAAPHKQELHQPISNPPESAKATTSTDTLSDAKTPRTRFDEIISAASEEPRPLAKRNEAIAGIWLGATTDQVLAKRGNPRTKTKTTSGNEGHMVVWHYDGLEITITGNRVFEIVATSSRWKTPKGIRVGSDATSLLAVYGPPHDVRSNTLVYCEKPTNEACVFSVEVDSSAIITGISLSGEFFD
jgi:hypothetical protein